MKKKLNIHQSIENIRRRLNPTVEMCGKEWKNLHKPKTAMITREEFDFLYSLYIDGEAKNGDDFL
ncbi:MAG: hypothetical protein R3230_00365 [Nitrosopumilaceae archaeon]|nr:hypothetical protein [Nitrosopumilaceae archaeon]